MHDFMLSNRKKKKGGVPLKKIITGTTVFGVLTESGNLYMRGRGDQGALGSGNSSNITDRWFLSNTDVQDVWLFSSTTVIHKNDGTWWYTGGSSFLGGSNTLSLSWVDVTSYFPSDAALGGIKQVVLSSQYILLLTNNNVVYGMGASNRGQLGTGSGASKTSLGVIPISTADNPVVKIDVDRGGFTSYFLYQDGTLKASGDSTYGQLGNTNTTNLSPIQVETGVSDFWTGTSCYYAKKSDGLYVRGRSFNGQLGDGVNGSATAARTVSFKVTLPAGISIDAMYGGTYQTHLRSGSDWYFTGAQGANNGCSISSGIWASAILTFTKIPSGMEPAGDHGVLDKIYSSYTAMYCLVDDMLYGCGTYNSNYNLLPDFTASVYGLKALNITGIT